MLKIRLQRVGKKHDPRFRVVITDSKNSPKSGKFLEVLGSYDPRKGALEIKGDKIKYWISKGAKVSGTIHNILVQEKIIEGKKINVLPLKKPIKKEETEEEKKKSEEVAKEGVEKSLDENFKEEDSDSQKEEKVEEVKEEKKEEIVDSEK